MNHSFYITSSCLNLVIPSEPIREECVCEKPLLIYLLNKYLSVWYDSWLLLYSVILIFMKTGQITNSK